MENEYLGERIRKPLLDGERFVIEALENQDSVVEVTKIRNQVFYIERVELYNDITLYMVDAYVLGEGSVWKILKENTDVNCILVLSNWNQYTSAAKELAISNDIGLFTFSELMGAIHFSGRKFTGYEKISNEESNRTKLFKRR